MLIYGKGKWGRLKNEEWEDGRRRGGTTVEHFQTSSLLKYSVEYN
ncbi:MAG: hypothetical protein JWN83_543 [Chitinophagaceae bacterium]|nr:hypothetical protein [Chitinophagaceae bacterium]